MTVAQGRALVGMGLLIFSIGCSEVKFSGSVIQPILNKNGEVCVPDYQPCTTLQGNLGHTLNKVLPEGCPSTTLAESEPQCEPYTYSRCSQTATLSPQQANGLLKWIAKCQSQYPALHLLWRMTHNGEDLGVEDGSTTRIGKRGLYPVLEAKGDRAWHPPTSESASCAVPGGVDDVDTLCSPGCYAPEQRLLVSTKGDEQSIGEAIRSQVSTIAVVKESSVANRLEIQDASLGYSISSAEDEDQELTVIQTSSGRSLRLTLGHPLVGADGEIHLASEVSEGDELLRADGGSDRVVSVARTSYFGKVHNLAPVLKADIGEFVVSEGLVQGSHRHQLEAATLLNRQLFRNRLTTGLFN